MWETLTLKFTHECCNVDMTKVQNISLFHSHGILYTQRATYNGSLLSTQDTKKKHPCVKDKFDGNKHKLSKRSNIIPPLKFVSYHGIFTCPD